MQVKIWTGFVNLKINFKNNPFWEFWPFFLGKWQNQTEQRAIEVDQKSHLNTGYIKQTCIMKYMNKTEIYRPIHSTTTGYTLFPIKWLKTYGLNEHSIFIHHSRLNHNSIPNYILKITKYSRCIFFWGGKKFWKQGKSISWQFGSDVGKEQRGKNSDLSKNKELQQRLSFLGDSVFWAPPARPASTLPAPVRSTSELLAHTPPRHPLHRTPQDSPFGLS